MNDIINVGFGNYLMRSRIVTVISPDSAPVKRMIQEYKDRGMVIDSTCGRRTRSVIFTDCGQVVLSALQPETVAARISLNNAESVKPEQIDSSKDA